MPHAQDIHYMRHALRLASRAIGRSAPNPAVGAVIVKNGNIVGCGWTAHGGRPHAEPIALSQAGDGAKGATLYVTLEPCAHYGQTPPCMEAIIKAGITRVVAACGDPNPLVAGKGFSGLRAAGIEVIENICEKEARFLNEGFFSVIERKRPFVTLKLATSLDNKITRSDGKKWITNEQSRAHVHGLRARHDAIITGIGTVLADDPRLDCRLPGCEQDSPTRIVMDNHLRVPENAQILPAWIFAIAEAVERNSKKVAKLQAAGTRIFAYTRSLADVLHILANQGVTRLLVETGQKLASAFIENNLVDRIYWFSASVIIGHQGLYALNSEGMKKFMITKTEMLQGDHLAIYDCNNDK